MKTAILFASLLSINTSKAGTSLDSYRPSVLKDCQESSTSGSLMCRFDVSESMVSGLITSVMRERAKDNWKSNEVDGRMTTFTFNISATEKTTYYVSLDKNGVYKTEPGITNVGVYVKDSAEVKAESKTSSEQEKAATSNEAKIINAIANTYKVVKDKSTQQMKRLYSSASQKTTVDQTSGSKAVTQVLTDAWIVNEGKKQIISSIKRDNEILLDNIAVKLQNINNDSLKQTLLKAQDLQIELQKDTDATASTANQMEKEVVANLGISNSLNTLAGAENNLILDEDEAHQAVDGEKILTAALASGKVDDYLKYQENLSASIEGKGVVAAGALVASDISLLPLSFQTPEQIKKINQAKGLLDLDKKANSASAKSTSATQSTSGVLSSAGLSSSVSLSVVPFTEGKVVSGDFSVQRPPYLLEPVYKSLFADPKQGQSFEIVTYLKSLEDLISYKVSRVTETGLSTRTDRLDKTYYGFGYSQKSLEDHAFKIVNLYNQKAAIQKTIDVTIPERIKALEVEYDPQNPKWSNHIVKNKREPRYQLALSQTQEDKKRLAKELSTANLNIYRESEVLLRSLFMLAESVCPKNMTLNQTWQLTKPDSKEGLRRYVCEGQDRKGHMISFDKLPSMPKHAKAEVGFVTLNPGSIKDSTGKYLYNSGSVIDLGAFTCPDITSTKIFGNEMNVQFSSVVYELSGSRQLSARFTGGKEPSWSASTYTSSPITNNKREGRCIPRESNKQYMKDSRSTSDNICEGEEIVVVDIIQNDRIDTKWKIDKTKSIVCTYEFNYTP